MTYRHIAVEPIAGALGAEITGVDLSAQIGTREVMEEIHRAFLEYGVIFFRDQEITPDQHIEFGRHFGKPIGHPVFEPLKGYPEIFPIIKEKEDAANIGNAWHADVTYMEEPALGSILYAREVPPYGGDTMFANMYLAYETLSEGMKALLTRLVAVHTGRRAYGAKDDLKKRFDARNKSMKSIATDEIEKFAEHPVIRTHPETGRKALFVNRGFTSHFKDMTGKESRPLLEFLYEHASRPEFTCRFRWRPNSIAFWDNRCVHHYAINDYQGQRRAMHRVTIHGDRPFLDRNATALNA